MGIFLEKGHKEIVSLASREVFHGLYISIQENFSYLLRFLPHLSHPAQNSLLLIQNNIGDIFHMP